MLEFIIGFVLGAIAGLIYGYKNKGTAAAANDYYENVENKVKDRLDRHN